MILIKNGRVIDPKSKMDEVIDIVIKDNKILKISLKVFLFTNY